MPESRTLLSAHAEHAIADIRLIVHEHLAARVGDIRTHVGRFGGPHTGFGDRATQLAVANVVGVVEHYAELTLLDADAPPNKVKTWDNKLQAWFDCFGKDPTTACPSFQPMRGYYEARNAIMHRGGELTDTQRKDPNYERLRAAGITLIGFNVVVDLTTLRACASTCVTCIEQLDANRWVEG